MRSSRSARQSVRFSNDGPPSGKRTVGVDHNSFRTRIIRLKVVTMGSAFPMLDENRVLRPNRSTFIEATCAIPRSALVKGGPGKGLVPGPV